MTASITETFQASTPPSRRRLRAGTIVSAIPVLFLLFDSVIKLVKIEPVVESFARMQIPDSLARGIGLLELGCLALYVLPRTAVLGAVLLTGFLGGAVASHLRLGDPTSVTRSFRYTSVRCFGQACCCAIGGLFCCSALQT